MVLRATIPLGARLFAYDQNECVIVGNFYSVLYRVLLVLIHVLILERIPTLVFGI